MSLFDGPVPVLKEKERNAPIVLDGGGGFYYGIDEEHAGQIIIDDVYGAARQFLEKSPAVNVAARCIARVLKSIPLKLTLDGEDYPKRGTHPVLQLWNEGPNEFQTSTAFRELVAEELVYSGEAIIRVFRMGNTPVRLFVWPAESTSLNYRESYPNLSEVTQQLIYQYESFTQVFDPELPALMHARLNVHPNFQLRGRPAVHGMPDEVIASAFASMFRRETFRQGGPPRLGIQQDKDSPEVNEKAGKRMARSFSRKVKSSGSWRQTPVLPAGWEAKNLGQEGQDPMMDKSSRLVDEKLLASYGIPLTHANNLERATYSNVRTEDRKMVRDSVVPLLDELGECIRRDLLIPMGGVHAKLKPSWDLDKALEAEAVIWNAMVINRYKAKMIGLSEARKDLGYDETPPEDLLKPEPVPQPAEEPTAPSGSEPSDTDPGLDSQE